MTLTKSDIVDDLLETGFTRKRMVKMSSSRVLENSASSKKKKGGEGTRLQVMTLS